MRVFDATYINYDCFWCRDPVGSATIGRPIALKLNSRMTSDGIGDRRLLFFEKRTRLSIREAI